LKHEPPAGSASLTAISGSLPSAPFMKYPPRFYARVSRKRRRKCVSKFCQSERSIHTNLNEFVACAVLVANFLALCVPLVWDLIFLAGFERKKERKKEAAEGSTTNQRLQNGRKRGLTCVHPIRKGLADLDLSADDPVGDVGGTWGASEQREQLQTPVGWLFTALRLSVLVAPRHVALDGPVLVRRAALRVAKKEKGVVGQRKGAVGKSCVLPYHESPSYHEQKERPAGFGLRPCVVHKKARAGKVSRKRRKKRERQERLQPCW
jgi:hypothetical protein